MTLTFWLKLREARYIFSSCGSEVAPEGEGFVGIGVGRARGRNGNGGEDDNGGRG